MIERSDNKKLKTPRAPEKGTSDDLPSAVDVVIIGGGIIGANVAYQVAKTGLTVALLERDVLTSGTTWHSAAGVVDLAHSAAVVELAEQSVSLYQQLPELVGYQTSWRQPGFLEVATTEDRQKELKRKKSRLSAVGKHVSLITSEEAVSLCPILDRNEVVSALWYEQGGRVDPNDTTQALVGGARQLGALVCLNTTVTNLIIHSGKIAGVETSKGKISTRRVVIACGTWSAVLAKGAGDLLPIQPVEHGYVITEVMQQVDRMMPWMRIPDANSYLREEVGGILIGFFEPNAKPLAPHIIHRDPSYISLPEDWDHVGPLLEKVSRVIPSLRSVGIKKLFMGPEAFTPDAQPIIGESPNTEGLFYACAMNSMGVTIGGGVGIAISSLVRGETSRVDLSEFDAKRFDNHSGNLNYLWARVPEVVSAHHDIPWPEKTFQRGRPYRTSPFYLKLRAAGARFTSKALWERASWFDSSGLPREPENSFSSRDWLPLSRLEHKAVREQVGVFDLSPFGKIQIKGRDAEGFLSRVCARRLNSTVGETTYTPLLNEAGGIISDVVIMKLSENHYQLITGSQQRVHDRWWLKKQLKSTDVIEINDETMNTAVLAVAGPCSIELLSKLSSIDFGKSLKFGNFVSAEIGNSNVIVMKRSFTGEKGFEIFVSNEEALQFFDNLMEAGQSYGIRLAGDKAMESLRIEKGFKAWGPDIGPTDNLIEAGLDDGLDRDEDFVGKLALVGQRKERAKKYLVSLIFEHEIDECHGGEAVFLDGEVCGRVTSCAVGHTVGRTVGLAWVKMQEKGLARDVSIDTFGNFYRATASFADPISYRRMKEIKNCNSDRKIIGQGGELGESKSLIFGSSL